MEVIWLHLCPSHQISKFYIKLELCQAETIDKNNVAKVSMSYFKDCEGVANQDWLYLQHRSDDQVEFKVNLKPARMVIIRSGNLCCVKSVEEIRK